MRKTRRKARAKSERNPLCGRGGGTENPAAEKRTNVRDQPPYYGLRDYGADGQIGVEQSPEEYIARLTEVFAEVHRVLKDDGTLWLNIADSYAGSGKGPMTLAVEANGKNKDLYDMKSQASTKCRKSGRASSRKI